MRHYSELTIKFPADRRTWYITAEHTTGRLLRVHDGSIFLTGKSLLAVLKDRIELHHRISAPHIAVDRNNLEIARLLVEAGIKFIPDNEGRMPSLIAALCEASEELSDTIAGAEEKALASQGKAG